jgi:hypothetical protein
MELKKINTKKNLKSTSTNLIQTNHPDLQIRIIQYKENKKKIMKINFD